MLSAWRIPEPCLVAILLATLLIPAGQVFADEEQTASVLLLGSNLVTSLGVLYLCGGLLGTVTAWLARAGIDRFVLGVFACSALLALRYLHTSYNFVYTNDWQGHFDYADLISRHPFSIASYQGWETHHPPIYYLVSAFFIAIARSFNTIPVLTAVRFLSWICFLAFNAIGLLILRRARFSREGYRLSALLFLLWPASVHLATKINSEMMYYAIYNAALYYAIVWYQEGKPRQLVTSLCLASIALATRGNALILGAVIGTYLLIAMLRGNFRLSSLSSRQWVVVTCVFTACVWLNLMTIFLSTDSTHAMNMHLGNGRYIGVPLGNFITISLYEYFSIPFYNWSRIQTFWSVLFKTSLYGEYEWEFAGIARLLNGLLILLAAYASLPWLTGQWKKRGRIAPFLLGLLVPVMGLMAYEEWQSFLVAQDARYIYPSMLCFAALCGHSYDIALRRNDRPLMAVGSLLVWSFTLLGAVFFWDQVRL